MRKSATWIFKEINNWGLGPEAISQFSLRGGLGCVTDERRVPVERKRQTREGLPFRVPELNAKPGSYFIAVTRLPNRDL
jgi:hypothetical protein